MTIAERKAREAYDRENPWRPMDAAKSDGTICELLFNDMVGDFPAENRRFFLDRDGDWYAIDPPCRVSWPRPINWRPAFAKITPERRQYLKRQAAARQEFS